MIKVLTKLQGGDGPPIILVLKCSLFYMIIIIEYKEFKDKWWYIKELQLIHQH